MEVNMGKQLVKVMDNLGIRQAELARILNCERQRVFDLRASTEWKPLTILRLSKVLKVPVNYWFTDDDLQQRTTKIHP